jgi:hypothetical protein
VEKRAVTVAAPGGHSAVLLAQNNTESGMEAVVDFAIPQLFWAQRNAAARAASRSCASENNGWQP